MLLVPLLLVATACGRVTTGTGRGASATAAAAPAAATASAAAAAAFPVTVSDDRGRRVTNAKAPQRVVSGTEGTDEILLGMLPRARIAAVTTLAADPAWSWVAAQAKGMPTVGKGGLNAEAVLALHPDLIFVATYTQQTVVQQLEQAGVPVIEFGDFASAADIERHIRLIGRAVGESARANAMVAAMTSRLASVRAAVAHLPPARAVYYSSYGYVFGSKTLQDRMIADAGGVNLADAAGITSFKKVPLEEIVSLAPEWLLTDKTGGSVKIFGNPALSSVPAVRDHHVVALPARDLEVVSQYFAQAVAKLAQVLHPGVVIGR